MEITSSDEFQYDVFLSHSSEDKDVVREIANRLKSDGVRVWFDEWLVKPGDSIPAKIEDGLEHLQRNRLHGRSLGHSLETPARNQGRRGAGDLALGLWRTG